ncbi:MAG: peptide-methionine (S)-S-oxide reductase MsrA [Nitrospirota bacterium]
MILEPLILFSFLISYTSSAETTRFEKATFAGGCFWCMVPPFAKLEGIKEITAGYTGGHKKDPTYEEVCSGTTGHLEAIQIVFDPSKIRYEQILDIFWQQIDPTDPGGQFADRGSSYTTAIFYHNEQQRKIAELSKKDLEQSGRFNKHIVTQIRPAGPFYHAEEYHQDFWKKNPVRYKAYSTGSGRESYLKETWKKESKR